jgi:hypothetical protein
VPSKRRSASRDDYDNPWKEAIGRYLREFLALLFPAACDQIDWSRPPEQLDTELRKVIRAAATGNQRADLLFRVYLLDGSERFVLAHVEVQTTKDRQLADRLFRYCYRIYDRYHHRVAAFVALGDEHLEWNPDRFSWEVLGSKLSWEYPTVKLLDWEARWPELLASSNPFATILMAHLKTKGTRKNPGDRLDWKLQITEHIYATQPPDHGRELLRLVDWLMQLPAEQAIIYEEGLEALEAEHRMSYIPSFARKHWDAGIAKGIATGQANLLARLLEKRFGPLPSSVTEMLDKAEGSKVEQWGLRLLDARSLDEVFKEPRPRRQRAADSHA